jgi:hypothetical protein
LSCQHRMTHEMSHILYSTPFYITSSCSGDSSTGTCYTAKPSRYDFWQAQENFVFYAACRTGMAESVYGLDDRGSITDRGKILLFSITSRSASSTQPPTQWVPWSNYQEVRRLKREADYSLPSNAKLKNGGTTPPHRKSLFHYCVFSRCRGNVPTELFPSNGCCTVNGLHSCYLAMGLYVTLRERLISLWLYKENNKLRD